MGISNKKNNLLVSEEVSVTVLPTYTVQQHIVDNYRCLNLQQTVDYTHQTTYNQAARDTDHAVLHWRVLSTQRIRPLMCDIINFQLK